MDFIKSIQIKALKAISDPNIEDFLRAVFRSYSIKFHTPLHEVPDLPIEDVLLAYYEETFECMQEEERSHIMSEILQTDEERKKLDLAEEQLLQKIANDVKTGKSPKKQNKLPIATPIPQLPDINMKF